MAMSEQELLLLAAALSALTYNLGALLLGMPLPFPTIKRLGPALMKDALFSLIAVGLSSLIISIPTAIYQRLNADWGLFDGWIAQRALLLVSMRAGVSLASGLLSGVAGDLAVESVVEPFSKSINYSLLTLYTILSLSFIVRYHYVKFIVLGILLSSVPLKLARGAGCYLIAFSIVFYAGAPLMPLFVDNFSTPTENLSINSDVTQGAIRVTDYYGRPVANAVISGYDLNTGELLFRYITGGAGTTSLRSPLDGLPSSRPYRLEAEVFGENVGVEPAVVDPSIYQRLFGGRAELNVNLTNLVVLRDNVYLIFPFNGIERIERNDEETVVYLNGSDDFLLIVSPAECSLDIVNGRFYTYTGEWIGVLAARRQVFIENASEPLRIRAGPCDAPRIDVYVPYSLSGGYSAKDRLMLLASQLLLNYVVLPSVYIALLFSIAAALASLLSGTRGKLPIRPW